MVIATASDDDASDELSPGKVTVNEELYGRYSAASVAAAGSVRQKVDD